ncbi:MAG: putative ATPase, partial [Methylobacterium brachiatum]|nr:putative ATPase [Methylobacterium brachiatum]
MTSLETLMPLLERIATALERAAPPAAPAFDPNAADAFLWGPERRLTPVPQVARVEIGLLTGIDRARDTLIEN